ncbi:hypothetical protein ACFQ61_08990 [Streptomyces sp. NPDC056500]|uniref:hypothetical protein n=1 Tax=Streptomyces sp. NPDC056500 TaxID=3345840 RepID=UPI00368E7653
MSASTGPAAGVGERRQPGAAGRLGTALCAVVLTVGHLVTGFVVLTAYMVEPNGPWDRQAITNSGIAAGIALALTAVTALLTWLFVKAEWLRRWWFALPAVFAVAAILRLTLLAPEL